MKDTTNFGCLTNTEKLQNYIFYFIVLIFHLNSYRANVQIAL